MQAGTWHSHSFANAELASEVPSSVAHIRVGSLFPIGPTKVSNLTTFAADRVAPTENVSLNC